MHDIIRLFSKMSFAFNNDISDVDIRFNGYECSISVDISGVGNLHIVAIESGNKTLKVAKAALNSTGDNINVIKDIGGSKIRYVNTQSLETDIDNIVNTITQKYKRTY